MLQGDVQTVLKAYFDGSKNDQAGSITLAAIAADEKLWLDFESQWKLVLVQRGNAPYAHMKEAMSLEGAFKGWTPFDRNWLIAGLNDLITEFSGRHRFQGFACTVDLEAHERWKRARSLPPPERLCARLIFPKIMDWYGTFPDLIMDSMEAFFDRNEGFMHHISSDWNNPKIRRKYPVWSLIKTIAPAHMKDTPPLQAADMLAWSRNRLANSLPSSPLALKPDLSVTDNFSLIAKLIFSGAKVYHWTINERALATRSFPE